MMKRILTLAAAVTVAAPAMAQDFTAGSEAKEWGLYAEQKAFFAATVVDPLCELTGNCPEDCGGGARQLALVREADGVMVLPMKNNQPAFTGAATDLAPWCGQVVEVDGLLLDDPDLGAKNVYLVQKIRAKGDSDWTKADRWTKVWAETHPDAAGEGPWFRRDPRVNAEIAKDGYFGLGLDVDATYIEENF